MLVNWPKSSTQGATGEESRGRKKGKQEKRKVTKGKTRGKGGDDK